MLFKRELVESIPLHVQGQNNGKGIYELKDCVGEKALNSILLPKLGLVKKNFLQFFPITY
jgi:hypothetical protein